MNTTPASLPPETKTSNEKPSLVRGLSLLDSVLLLVSGIIGSSIFLTAKDIAGPLPNPTPFFLVWVLGGALLQNVSTWTKFAAMAAFVVLGFAIGKGHWSNFSAQAPGGLTMGLGPGQLISALGVGLIAVFFAYDGWVYITWVAGEVKEPRRNVPLAMVLGVLAVGAIYLAMNVTYVYALPLNEVAKYETIAHAAAAALFSPRVAIWLSL